MLVDLVKIQVNSSGTDPFQLGVAVPSFRGIEALIDGVEYSYSVQSGSRYEVGKGVYIASSSQLIRNPTLSSAGNATVNFEANVEVAFVAAAADLGGDVTDSVLQVLATDGGAAMIGAASGATVQQEITVVNDGLAARPTFAVLAASGAAAVIGSEDGTVQGDLTSALTITDKFTYSDSIVHSAERFGFGMEGVLQSLWGDGFENNTRHFVGNPIGRCAIAGFTRSSDNPNIGDMASYAFGAFTEHDSNKFAYGQYTEARRRSGAGALHGQEIAIINFGSTVDVDPYDPYAANLTDVLRLSTGRGDTPTQTNVSAYLHLVSVSGAKALRGINIGYDALVETGGQQDAINMASGQALQWWTAAGARGARIRSDGGASPMALVFADNLIAFQSAAFSNVMTIEPRRLTVATVIRPASYTVAELLALPSPQQGDTATVTGVAGGGWLSQITTAGAVSSAPAFYNGSTWCLG